MKKSNFLSTIITMLTSLFLPLYEAAERKFTLNIITQVNSSAPIKSTPSAPAPNLNISISNSSAIDRNSDPIIDTMSASNATPSTLQQTVSSVTGSGATDITVFFLNEDVYNATPTNNGSGSDSVTNSYSDGWTGNGYNNLAKSVNQGRGIMVYGLTMIYKTISTGAQNPNALAGSEVQLVTSTLVGNKQRPDPSPLNEGVNASNYQTGTMTVYKKFFLSSLNQISYVLPNDNESTLIILCKPQAGQA